MRPPWHARMDKRDYYRQAAVACDYDRLRFGSDGGRRAHEIELAAIRRAFVPQERLCELACGTGRLLKPLLRDGWQVIGVEQSAPMLAAGGSELQSAAVLGDAFRLPFRDGAFDGAYCLRFTNHYAELGPFFAECARILTDRGHLLFDSLRWSPLRVNLGIWGGRNHCVGDARIVRCVRAAGFLLDWSSPLFAVNPYMLGRLPPPMVRALFKMQKHLPSMLQAVKIWHVRKNR